LPPQKRRERLQIRTANRLVGDDRQAGTLVEFFTNCEKVSADFSVKACFLENKCGNLTVTPIGREDNCTFRKWSRLTHLSLP
jgi:hypothetical protein